MRPPTIAMPSGRRSSEPSPMPSTSGSAPSSPARLVMTMGRSRSRAASSVADTRPWPSRTRSLATSTIRIAFLADKPMVAIRPTLK
ncbi:hypothetical protein G6F62_014764 [Rhizopus arrhizus]|nr:hypothetical protein G6F62_014764 [Rhizopus arrhizus]